MRGHLASLALLAAVVGCNKETALKPVPADAALPDAPIRVAVTSPKKQTLAWGIEQPGSIQAYESTPVVAKFPGYVRQLFVDIGDKVKKGQLLAKLSIPEVEVESQQKAALLEMATAEVALARRNAEVATETAKAVEPLIAVGRANVDKATADSARWDSEWKRSKDLFTKKLIDEQQLDEAMRQAAAAVAAKAAAEANVLAARANYKEAQAKIARAEAEIAVVLGKEKVAGASAKLALALLDYTDIRAPFDGVVTSRQVHTGHFLQPSSGGKVEPLFVVARLDTVRVFVEVPENQAEKAVPGAAVAIRIPALANRDVVGAVTRTAGVLSPESRTLRVEIDLPNPDGTLRPGLYCNVRIAATSADAQVVPAAAVLFADETAYCYQIEDGKAKKLRVQVGRADKGNLELLGKRPAGTTSGAWQPIAGTEQIAVGNLGALVDGQAVQVETPAK